MTTINSVLPNGQRLAGQQPLIEKVILGLAIIGKYPNCHIAAQEHVIHAGIDDHSLMPIEEVKDLLKLGWHQTELGWAR